jgi:phenylpyruvate tautomerase PptA (4-oxalocrotonate tautomerase family)
MPFIDTKATVSISKEKELQLKERFGKAIELIRGKTERWLMLSFSGEESMYFAGSDEPSAILEVKIFGKASEGEYQRLTAALCSAITEILGIDGTRVYVKYEEVDTWGYNGMNF